MAVSTSAHFPHFSTDTLVGDRHYRLPLLVVCAGLALSAGLFYCVHVSERHVAALSVLAAGVLFTVAATAYAFMLANREWVIHERVDLRTRTLAEATAALEGETRLMQAVLNTVGDGVAVTDPDGRVLLWNPAAEAMLGPRPTGNDPAAWMSDSELFTGDDRTAPPLGELPLTRVLRGEPGEALEFHARGGHAGEGRWMSMFSRPLEDSHGQLLGAMIVFRDITALKLADRQVRNLNALLERRVAARTVELRRSNEELQQFAFIASHDLHEPLRKVRVFGDRLRTKCGEALDERGRDYLDRMQRASARMESLLTNLLSLSRISTRGEAFAPTALAQVAREAVSDLEVRIAETQATIEIGDLPTLDADGTQIRQLFQNLITNSLKFRREAVPPRITIEGETVASEEGACCRIRVHDNGIGFEQKYAEQIFVPLQRLHGTGAYEGTGIGLATCRKIVERHGGTITAVGQEGAGAAFIIVLPVNQPESETQGCPETKTPLSF